MVASQHHKKVYILYDIACMLHKHLLVSFMQFCYNIYIIVGSCTCVFIFTVRTGEGQICWDASTLRYLSFMHMATRLIVR